MEEVKKVDLETALELTGFGKYHVRIILMCGVFLTITNISNLEASLLSVATKCDFSLTTALQGYLLGSCPLGMIFSAHAMGFAADTIGRKKVLMTSAFAAWTLDILSALSPNVQTLIALRFVTGMCSTGISSVTYAYLGEFLAINKRTALMTWMSGFFALAYIILPLFAWSILPLNIDWDIGFIVVKPWRIFGLALSSFCLIDGLVLTCHSETPKFLLSVGKKEEALNLLRSIYATNSGKSPNEYPVKDLQYDAPQRRKDDSVSPEKGSSYLSLIKQFFILVGDQTIPLFNHPYLSKTLLFCALQFSFFFTPVGIYYWLPTIVTIKMTDLGSGIQNSTICQIISRQKQEFPNRNVTECSNVIGTEAYLSSLGTGLFFIAYAAITSALCSIFEKWKILVLIQTLAGLCGILICFTKDLIPLVICMATFIGLGSCSITVVGAAIVDVYPTNLRAMAVTLALTTGRTGSSLAGNIFGLMLESNCDATILGLGCMTVCTGFLCIAMPRAEKSDHTPRRAIDNS